MTIDLGSAVVNDEGYIGFESGVTGTVTVTVSFLGRTKVYNVFLSKASQQELPDVFSSLSDGRIRK